MAGTEKKRIIELTEASTVQSGDFIAVDSNARGTKKVPTSALATSAALTAETNARAGADEQMSERMDGIEEQTALIQNPTKTLSGALVSFTDGANMPMVACTAEIEPKQSGTGTPSPSNVRPISGWESVNVNVSGVNVWDEQWENGYRNVTTGAIVPNASDITNKNLIRCLPNTSYYWYVGKSGSNYIVYFDAEQNRIGAYWANYNSTFTTPPNCRYIAFTVNNTTYNNDTSINYPSTDHDYHAYTGTTTTVNLGRTVYGGEAEIVGGSLTDAKRYRLLDGTESDWYDYEYSGVSTFRFVPGDMASVQSTEGVIITNEFTFRNVAWAHGEDYGTFSGSGTSIYFRPPNAEITTLAEFKTWLASNPLQIVYPLAQPQTYQLTPTEVSTLLGDNNVWADSGDVEITYRRDISIVINNLEAALNG